MQKNSYAPVWVSQNFLTSSQTIGRLIKKTTISPNDHVVEIGPGKGHITAVLLQHCKQVSAIEIDKGLYRKLQAKFETTNAYNARPGYICLHNTASHNTGSLKLYCQDFIKWNLPQKGEYKVFANIPFNHTTAIIQKLTQSQNPPTDAWLIIEKGAAKRFMGLPKESLRSLMIKPLFDMSIVYHFRREDFHPMPRVDVVMVHLKMKTTLDVPQHQWPSYRNFITKAMKYNGLMQIFTKKQLSRACKEAGLSDITSAEILYIQWLCLFRCYVKVKN